MFKCCLLCSQLTRSSIVKIGLLEKLRIWLNTVPVLFFPFSEGISTNLKAENISYREFCSVLSIDAEF